MSQRDSYRGNSPNVGISAETRARLHRSLDELLDLQNEIAERVDQSEMSNELADQMQHLAERLVIRASHFAGHVAGGEARAIAFRHAEPTSRAAFLRFLNVVAEYAAPYAYATLNLGIDTFTWTDAMAIVDDMHSLDHGDRTERLEPSAKRRPRGTQYYLLKEQWRAVLWVSYLTGQTGKEAAVKEVADAYGVSDRTIYGWTKVTEQIEGGYRREWSLEDARKAGESGAKPHFTRSPYRFEDDQPYTAWLEYDALYYRNSAKTDA